MIPGQHNSKELQQFSEKENYYEILDLSSHATTEEIQMAYEIAQQTYQENSLATYSLFSNEENDKIMRRITVAYMTLMDPITRNEYDNKLFGREKIFREQFSTQSSPSLKPEPDTPSKVETSPTPRQHIPSFKSHMTFPSRNEDISPEKSFSLNKQGSDAPRVPDTSPKPQGFRKVPPALGDTSRKTDQEKSAAPNQPLNQEKEVSIQIAEYDLKERRVANRKIIASKIENSQETVQKFLDSVVSFTGKTLQQIRLLRGIDLSEISTEICVRKVYLDAIETEDFSRFAAPIYLKGYLRGYAKALRLPVEHVVDDYMSLFNTYKNPKNKK